jgi:ribonucleoside-diphosphate reductase alpha chain
MSFSEDIMNLRYAWEINGRKETWDEISHRVVKNVMGVFDLPKDVIDEIEQIIKTRKFIPGGRFLAQSGREYHQTNNCFLLRAEDTREGWGELLNKSAVALMSGGGIGIDYSALRPNGSLLKKSGGTSSGPLPLMSAVNEVGRGVMAGGKRRSAIWAGLRWNHPDIFDFIKMKNWIPEVRKLKETNYDFPATLDMTNISVILDKNFFDAYENNDNIAKRIYWEVIDRMVRTGEPGFSIDYDDIDESLRNACTEITSKDDSDVCCLGSVNLANIETLQELKEVTLLGQLFLIAGVQYSDVPYEKVKLIKEKNNRTGLGLMGIHEWLIKRGYSYDPNPEFETWLQNWQDASNITAKEVSNRFSLNEPIKKRAIAPNGSISIAGGMTTSGIEPIFSIAYKRRYLTPDGWKMQYIVDFVAEKLHNQGYDLSKVEDAYSLSFDVERRVRFQAFVQRFVDNAISSTINLPEWETPGNNNKESFGKILYKYLPQLRGITAYPDRARGGQPLSPVSFDLAIKHKGVIFEGHEECENGVCGL